MAKRKAQNPLKDAKLVKKSPKMKNEEFLPDKESDDIVDKKNSGKNDICIKVEKEDNSNLKKEALSPELLDEDQNITKADFPNIELNQLLQKKSKFNPFGTTSWKVFLSLHF